MLPVSERTMMTRQGVLSLLGSRMMHENSEESSWLRKYASRVQEKLLYVSEKRTKIYSLQQIKRTGFLGIRARKATLF